MGKREEDRLIKNTKRVIHALSKDCIYWLEKAIQISEEEASRKDVEELRDKFLETIEKLHDRKIEHIKRWKDYEDEEDRKK